MNIRQEREKTLADLEQSRENGAVENRDENYRGDRREQSYQGETVCSLKNKESMNSERTHNEN